MFRNYSVLRSPEPAPTSGGGVVSNQTVKKELKKVNGVQKTKKAPKVPAQRDVVDLDVPVGVFNIKDLKKASGAVPEELKDNAVRLLTELDKLCTLLGVGREAVTIVSGYRSPTYNEKIAGAKKSKHMTAEAADIRIKGYTPKVLFGKVYQWARAGELKFKGMGLYDGWIHVDVRQEDKITTWYDTSDKAILAASKTDKSKLLKLLLG
jgi:uncharacterized protein YcbK (DUF882 family)